jgi:hypothetical protein
MSNIPIAFCVVGALVTLYVVAWTWDPDAQDRRTSQSAGPRQRGRHWWRQRP